MGLVWVWGVGLGYQGCGFAGKIFRVVESVANFKEYRAIVGNQRVAIRVGDIGRHCFRFSYEAPEDCKFLSSGLGGCMGSEISQNGVSVFMSVNTSSRRPYSMAIGRRLISKCVGTFGRVDRGCSVPGSISAISLSHFPSIFAIRGTPRSRSRVATSILSTTGVTISTFITVHRARNRGVGRSVLSETGAVLSIINRVRRHSPRAITRCRRELVRHVGRALTRGSIGISRREILARITIFTSGMTITRRAMELHDRFSRLSGFLRCSRPINEGVSFVVRRVGHRSGAVNSGIRSTVLTRGIISVGDRVRGVHRRIRGVRWNRRVGLVGVNFNGLIDSSGVITMITPSSTPMGQVIRSTGRGGLLVSTAYKQGYGSIVITRGGRIVLSTVSYRTVRGEASRDRRGGSRRWRGEGSCFICQFVKYERKCGGRKAS